MLKENPRRSKSQESGQSFGAIEESAWGTFRPGSMVAEGVQVERQHVRPGSVECSASPNMLIAVHDGQATQISQKLRGRMHRRTSVMGDVEIYPAGFSEGTVLIERASDQLIVGVDPRVFAQTIESLGVDSSRVEFIPLFGSQDPTIAHIVRRLYQETQTRSLGGRLFTDALLTELVIHLLREYSSLGKHEKEQSPVQDPLQPALEMIHDDLHADLSLQRLAKAVQLSPHHFSRAFKRVTGRSPHQYVLWQRVQLAKRLLIETRLSLAEVADQAGFYDQSHFSYHFKRLVGLTPMAFRGRKNVQS
jgi:AraC family transcriptional regulator